jgi:hypothetical protein
MAILSVVLALVAVNFIALYFHCLRESRALGEYAQFLLMHPDGYEDQRRKYIEYLKATGRKNAAIRSIDAFRATIRIAKNMHGQLILGNSATRNAIAGSKI